MKLICKSLIFLFTCFYSTCSFSQDVITKKDGTDIKSKILEVTTSEVKYKKFDNQTGPTFTIVKSDLMMVRYENGTNDIFNQSNVSSNNSPSESGELCDQGKQDAKVNYKGRNSGSGWTCATTILFSPIIGIIPAAVCSSSEPAQSNLNAPNSELMKKNKYSECYVDQAYKAKKKKVWTNFGIGSGVWLLLILVLGAG